MGAGGDTKWWKPVNETGEGREHAERPTRSRGVTGTAALARPTGTSHFPHFTSFRLKVGPSDACSTPGPRGPSGWSRLRRLTRAAGRAPGPRVTLPPEWHVPRWAPVATLLGVAAFVGLTGASAFVYPGGSHLHRDAPRYSVVYNYWCDLYRAAAYDGAPHPGASWALLGAVGVIAAVGAGLVTASGYPGTSRRDRRATRAMIALTCVALPAVPFTPADTHGALHFGLIGVSALPALVALGLAGRSVLRGASHVARPGALRALTLATLIATALHFGHYLLELFGGAAFSAGVPLEQKVVTAIQLAWLVAVALSARGRSPRDPPRPEGRAAGSHR